MHLVSVWNPSYADDALNAHASLLRALTSEARGSGTWDAAYSEAVGRERAVRWRNRICGVGELGVVGQVVGSRR